MSEKAMYSQGYGGRRGRSNAYGGDHPDTYSGRWSGGNAGGHDSHVHGQGGHGVHDGGSAFGGGAGHGDHIHRRSDHGHGGPIPRLGDHVFSEDDIAEMFGGATTEGEGMYPEVPRGSQPYRQGFGWSFSPEGGSTAPSYSWGSGPIPFRHLDEEKNLNHDGDRELAVRELMAAGYDQAEAEELLEEIKYACAWERRLMRQSNPGVHQTCGRPFHPPGGSRGVPGHIHGMSGCSQNWRGWASQTHGYGGGSRGRRAPSGLSDVED